ncbi:MAG TPA: glycosyltransferase family 4 protein [Chthoniobacterales bacterium]
MTILFLTKGYARYRRDLVEAVAEALSPRDTLLLATPSAKEELWEVDWDSLSKNQGRVYYRDFPRAGLKDAFILLKRRVWPRPHRSEPAAARFRQLNPDLVVIQEFSWPMLKVAICCRLAGIPCVVCSDIGEQTNWSYGQFSRRAWLVHALVSWIPTGLVAHTPAAMNPIAAKRRPKIFIPHSIDLRRSRSALEHPQKTGDKVIGLVVAAYNERKGYDLLAQAIRLLKEKGIRNMEFRWVGTENPAWLESVIATEGIGEGVKVLGVLKGEPLFQEFERADFFVLPTRADTYAVVVHEAAGFGLPLVISKFAGSASVLVNEGENGFVVDPNEIEVFADRLELLIGDEGLRQRFAQNSLRVGKKYCASQMGRQLAEWLLPHVRRDRSLLSSE